MNVKRKLTSVYVPPVQPGFLGKGHVARPVIQSDFSKSDPFIVLMDDMLDKNDHLPVGGPHPHAGFETVSLLLQGDMGDGMHAGDFEIMTAGRGVVHTETISKPTKMRLFQLWLNLPKDQRHATPRIQRLSAERVPQALRNGSDIRVYSGSFAGLTSPIRNYTPLIVAEVRMKAAASLAELIPAEFNTFLLVIDGSITVGEEKKAVSKDEVGWLDLHDQPASSELLINAGNEGAHFVIYAAQPQHHAIVSHGPFVADTIDDIKRLYSEFRQGKMRHISEVTADQNFVL